MLDLAQRLGVQRRVGPKRDCPCVIGGKRPPILPRNEDFRTRTRRHVSHTATGHQSVFRDSVRWHAASYAGWSGSVRRSLDSPVNHCEVQRRGRSEGIVQESAADAEPKERKDPVREGSITFSGFPPLVRAVDRNLFMVRTTPGIRSKPTLRVVAGCGVDRRQFA